MGCATMVFLGCVEELRQSVDDFAREEEAAMGSAGAWNPSPRSSWGVAVGGRVAEQWRDITRLRGEVGRCEAPHASTGSRCLVLQT